MEMQGYGDRINGSDRPPVLTVLYVDDEPFLLDVCKLYLERHPDISVSIASCVKDALELMETQSYDVVVSDYQMPGMNGIAFFRHLREHDCQIPFILFTGRGREEIMDESHGTTLPGYICKGGNPKLRFDELAYRIREACGQIPAEPLLPEKMLQYPAAP
jgi:CheY-like chemotaxis protein